MIAASSKSARLHSLILFPLAGALLGGTEVKRTLCYRCNTCGFEFRLFRADLMISAAVCTAIYGTGIILAFRFRDVIAKESLWNATVLMGVLLAWAASILASAIWTRIKYPVTRATYTDAKKEIRNL